MKINMKKHYVTFKVKYPINVEELVHLTENEAKAKILAEFKYALDSDIELFRDEVKFHPKTRAVLNYE